MVARLEAELSLARTELEAATAGQAKVRSQLRAAQEEAADARHQAEHARAAKDAAERALLVAKEEMSVAQEQQEQQEQLQQQRQKQQQLQQAPAQAAVREAAAAAALAEKSATIEQLMSERTALRFQLERESERRQALERQQQGQGHGSQHRVIEMPEARTPLASRARDGAPQPRLLSVLLRRTVKEPPPALVYAVATVDELAELVDVGALTMGRHLRVHRPLRLGAIGYLVLLHCWLVVLLIHMIPNLEPARMRTEHHATLAHENSALSSPLLAEALNHSALAPRSLRSSRDSRY